MEKKIIIETKKKKTMQSLNTLIIKLQVLLIGCNWISVMN